MSYFVKKVSRSKYCSSCLTGIDLLETENVFQLWFSCCDNSQVCWVKQVPNKWLLNFRVMHLQSRVLIPTQVL